MNTIEHAQVSEEPQHYRAFTPPPHWPPPYTVRRSLRARQIILQIKPMHGLEIIIPSYRQRFNIQTILEEKRDWIEKMLKKMDFYENNTDPLNPRGDSQDPANRLAFRAPDLIECPGIAESWRVLYQQKSNQKKIRLTPLGGEKTLLISGNIESNLDNNSQCQRVLIQWLMQQAHHHLIPWLIDLSTLTNLSFQRVIIRGQSTLWGSCNAKKTISLNYKLLFLPRLLVQHVLLHELCHLQYLNHSLRFWKLLEKWDPECQRHKKALKTAERYLPRWLGRL